MIVLTAAQKGMKEKYRVITDVVKLNMSSVNYKEIPYEMQVCGETENFT